jgi:hypothetical protein
MKYANTIAAITLLVLVTQHAWSRAIDDLNAGLDAEKQDRNEQAIELYKHAITSGELDRTNLAAAESRLAYIFHDRRDFAAAERYALAAGKDDPGRFRFSVVPIWDELEKTAEIVKLVEPAFQAGDQNPSNLGPLLTAYSRLNRTDDAAAVARRLERASYEKANDRDYCHYVLAYWELYRGDKASAKVQIRQIVDARYRHYMRGSPKFRALSNDAEFQELTR